jgi:hypothetical protein
MVAVDFDFISALSQYERDKFMQEVWDEAIARVEAETMSRRDPELRGNNLAIQTMDDEQIVTHGPAGTGKSLAWLHKMNEECWEYPNLRCLIVREVRADLAESVLVTFERDILGYENPICAGAKRQDRDIYQYPNGSIIALGGMDRPGRFLSSEWDRIYFPECNQTTAEKWDILWSRLARDGAYPHPQLGGDCNPDRPDHWLKKKAKAGDIKLLATSHKDNPKYWSLKLKQWTDLGKRYVLGRLAKLKGLLYKRFFKGLWVMAEGAIYDTFSEDTHVKDDPYLIAHGWLKHSDPNNLDSPLVPGARVKRVISSQDWGFTKPGVQQVWLIDGDGRMCLAHEVYMTQKLNSWWVKKAQDAVTRWNVGVLVCDPSNPAAIEEMVQGGIFAIPAENDIRSGIDKTKERLDVLDDGLPRVLFRRAALDERDETREEKLEPCCLIDEIPGQVWKDKSKKEEAADGENHSWDAWRYATQEADANRAMEIINDNPLFG